MDQMDQDHNHNHNNNQQDHQVQKDKQQILLNKQDKQQMLLNQLDAIQILHQLLVEHQLEILGDALLVISSVFNFYCENEIWNNLIKNIASKIIF